MQYPYSGSDDETPESNLAGGGPSSILHAPGENTLRKNFQAIQERNEAIAAQQAAVVLHAEDDGLRGHPSVSDLHGRRALDFISLSQQLFLFVLLTQV